MKKILSLAIACFALGTETPRAAVAVYSNYGITNNPQIDARAIVNYGDIIYTLGELFDTQGTQYLTNRSSGQFYGYAGFRFDQATAQGARLPLVNFVNEGLVYAEEYPYTSTTIGPLGYLSGSYVLVDANNIQNKDTGILSVGPQGLIKLNGQNVDLTRGGLRAGLGPQQSMLGLIAASSRGTFSTNGTYTNPTGVFDSTGSQARSNRVGVASLANPFGYAAYAYTNMFSESNFMVQAVFVTTNGVDTNIVANVQFAPPTSTMWSQSIDPMPDSMSDGMIAVVELAMGDVDIITGDPVTNYVYVLDTSMLAGFNTNWTVISNTATIPGPGSRPIVFEATRSTPMEWQIGSPGNTIYTNSLLAGPPYLNATATNLFATYSFQVGIPVAQNNMGQLGSRYPYIIIANNVGIQEPTNWPGRIEITADHLNLNKARIRAESLVTLKANQLVPTNNPVVDAPHLFLDLSSDTGLLVISNLVKSSVKRLSGTVTVETHFYTNFIPLMTTNAPADTNTAETVETNYIEVKTQVLLVNYRQLRADALVLVDDVKFHSKNVVLNDVLSVNRGFLVDAENFRNSGEITLLDRLYDFGAANFPRMMNFTNEGVFNFINIARFGPDRGGSGYQNFVNRGLISGNSLWVRAQYFDNSGQLTNTGGPVTIEATAAKFDDGTISTVSTAKITADELKARNSQLLCAGFSLDATHIADGGSNRWTTSDGFQLVRKPETGDLFGFDITSMGSPFAQITHEWAAEDRGNSAAGYTNNAVIGRLFLNGAQFGSFYFVGVSNQSALYVDYLSITNVATNDLATAIEVAEGFAVYFADSNVRVELLDGLAGGRLRWCRNFAGPYSSVPVVDAYGRTNYYNRGLRNSQAIDSDGDGIVNGLDPTPFAGIRIRDIDVVSTPKAAALISWQAVTQQVYTVQYATNLAIPSWLLLTNFTYNAPTNGPVTVQDLLPKNSNQRYYRVLYLP